MAETYSITLEEAHEPASADFLRQQLLEYNLLHAVPIEHRLLAVYLKDEDGGVAGGLLGGTYWGWLAIDIFWLREDLRGQGYGSRLLQAAEAEAVRRGCHHAHLDTMDFQAPGFYEKHGYHVWGRLDDLPTGHARIFYMKELVRP